jgi:hypothetical protein
VQRSGTISGLGDPVADSQAQSTADDLWLRGARASQAAFVQSAFAQYLQLHAGKGSTPSSAGTGATAATTASTSGPTSGSVDLNTVLDSLYKAGFRGQDLVDMAAIPSRESGYVTDKHNLNAKTGDDSWGLWQINVAPGANAGYLPKVLGTNDPTTLEDPYKAAQVAYAMYQANGNTLRPWGGYKGMSNTYNVPQDAIDKAQAAAKQLNMIGDPYANVAAGPSGYVNGSSTTNVSNMPVVFNNTFHITPAQGTDTEALARNLAPRLVAQFQKAAGLKR